VEPEVRDETAVVELCATKGPLWRWIRGIRRRRPFLTAAFVVAATMHTLLSDARPYDLLRPTASPRFFIPWLLILFGIGVRLWGSGNLRKNREITDTGIYRLVRHPLYLGSLAFFLAYFLTVGDPRLGIVLFVVLVLLVYYPTMLTEEEYLTLKFPGQFARYQPPPRLLPDLRRLPEAVETDRFELRAAYRNLGFRSAWFLVLLPLYLRLIEQVQIVLF
jgi:protein-S-isoprenylcysteine O-methyltransferase Ste14